MILSVREKRSFLLGRGNAMLWRCYDKPQPVKLNSCLVKLTRSGEVNSL